MSDRWLAVVDADRIHEYVFSPRELKMIRGGSHLQGELNREEAPKLLGNGTLIAANGGTVFAEFSGRSAAEEYCRDVERLYLDRTAIATVSWAVAPHERHFSQDRRDLLEQLERVKRAQRRVHFEGGNSFSVLCQSCGGHPATERQVLEDGGWRGICTACQFRWAASKKDKDGRGYALPQSFEELGQLSSPQNYLAIVYIDLDRMGRFLDNGDLTAEEFGQLSRDVNDSVEQAVYSACWSVDVSPLTEGRRKGLSIAPYAVLLCGGDDAIVALPAGEVVGFVKKFREEFEKSALGTYPAGPTFSIGVAIAHSHFPIGEFVRVAERLLRSAKRKRDSHSIHLRILTESMAEDRPEEYRHRGDGVYRTKYPYTMSDFERMTSSVAQLKSNQAPASKIRSLYGIAHESPEQAALEYIVMLSRLDVRYRQILCMEIGGRLWRESEGRNSTNAADLAELWEFVDG